MSEAPVKQMRKSSSKNGKVPHSAKKLHSADKPRSPEAPRNDKQLARDRELVHKCVSGDVDGWDQLYNECHQQLLGNIRSLIRSNGSNSNLADEIASRVWYSLVEGNGSLLSRYDAHRGCKLSTFFAALARFELLRYWRSERRRREREQAVVRRRTRHRHDHGESFHVSWGEFVETLSRRERDFLEQVLISPDAETENGKLSQSNSYQLRSRVLTKLKRYSSDENS